MGIVIIEGKGHFGGEFGHPIVTNGDFIAWLCGSV